MTSWAEIRKRRKQYMKKHPSERSFERFKCATCGRYHYWDELGERCHGY